MKRVLVLSYHFPPQDIIAAYRGKAMLDYLPEHGYHTTILTHHWGNPQALKVDRKNGDGWTVLRLPFPSPGKKIPEKIGGLRKFWTASHLAKGILEPHLLNARRIFREFLREELARQRYDLLIGIFSPHFILELTSESGTAFNIPYVLDLRDLWTNRVINKDYNPGIREKIGDWITAYYWRKWFSNASFFSTTSDPWRKKLEKVTGIKGIVVKNGYEEELFYEPVFPDRKSFRIVHAGSIYNHQRIEVFLEGVRLFFEEVQPEKVSIEFIGAERGAYSNAPTSFTKDPASRIARILKKEDFLITRRKPKEKVIKDIRRAQLLLFPTFPRSPGTYSGKIFDYIGAQRPILAFPHDDDVIDELLGYTEAGDVMDSPRQIADHLKERYREWKECGYCHYRGRPERIREYSRREQIKVLAQAIDDRLNE